MGCPACAARDPRSLMPRVPACSRVSGFSPPQAYSVDGNAAFEPLAQIVLGAVTGSMCAVSPSNADPALMFPGIRSTPWDQQFTPCVAQG